MSVYDAYTFSFLLALTLIILVLATVAQDVVLNLISECAFHPF